MARPDLSLRVSPYCARLGSKKLMLARRPPMSDEDVLDASGYCWCEATFRVVGPDGCAAHPEDCRAGRPCFESPLERLLGP